MAHADLHSKNNSFLHLNELEQLAYEKLPKMSFDYYAGGAGDELTLRDSAAAYDRIKLRPRMLVDVSALNLKVDLFGTTIDNPIMIAPMAFQRLAHPDGEPAMAKAASRAKTIMVVSTLATTPLEEVAAATDGPLWFQLYVYKDKEVTIDLVSRAQEKGYKAIVLTVDSPILGRRYRDVKNLFQLPQHLKVANVSGVLEKFPTSNSDSGLAAYIASMYSPALTWKDLEWIAGLTKLPVLVKGVLRADDARKSLESGAQGIIVSNHGGRQLDSTISTIDALPEVAEAVGSKVPVLVDGGVRRGTDVLKALALGAKSTLVGRPLLWGLALDGEDGAHRVLETINEEFRQAMILSGNNDVASVERDMVVT